jgi:hypothetical protein
MRRRPSNSWWTTCHAGHRDVDASVPGSGSRLGADPLPEPLPHRPRLSHPNTLTRQNTKPPGVDLDRASFGTKRSWVRIPPPRLMEPQVKGLILTKDRALDSSPGPSWEKSGRRSCPGSRDGLPAACCAGGTTAGPVLWRGVRRARASGVQEARAPDPRPLAVSTEHGAEPCTQWRIAVPNPTRETRENDSEALVHAPVASSGARLGC